MSYEIARLDEIEEVTDGRCPFRPVRLHFGISSFGVNVWTGRAVGDRIRGNSADIAKLGEPFDGFRETSGIGTVLVDRLPKHPQIGLQRPFLRLVDGPEIARRRDRQERQPPAARSGASSARRLRSAGRSFSPMSRSTR